MNKTPTVFTLLFVIFLHVSPSHQWYFMYNGQPDCAPQKTPLYGRKWCNFTRKASELGSVCTFSCIRGFYLKGPEENQCVKFYDGKMARFKPNQGSCEPVPTLAQGNNGPYHIVPKSKPSFSFNANGRYQLDNTNVTGPSNNFYIQKPGLNGVAGTISMYSAVNTNRYVALQGIRLLVIPSGLTHSALGAWENIATFWLRQDKYYEGYAAFEPYAKRNEYLMVSDARVVLHDPQTEEDRSSASFSWKEIDAE